MIKGSIKKAIIIGGSIFCFLALLNPAIGAVATADTGLNSHGSVVRVGIYENPPKIYTDEQGVVSGLYADIINYIAWSEGWTVEFVTGTWDEGLSRLENGEIDIMTDVAYSKAREERFDFNNETVLVSWAAVYAAENVEIESILDLSGKDIAILKSGIHYTGEYGLKNLLDSFEIDATYIDVKYYKDVFNLLENGQADVGVVSRVFGAYNLKNYPNVRPTTVIFNPVELKFAFTKGSIKNTYLIKRIDYRLHELKTDPESIYYEFLNEILGEPVTIFEIIPEWVKQVVIIIGVLAITSLIAAVILRRQVRRKTHELSELNKKLLADISRRKKIEAQLKKRTAQLERFAALAVGREERMVELKKTIKELRKDRKKNK